MSIDRIDRVLLITKKLAVDFNNRVRIEQVSLPSLYSRSSSYSIHKLLIINAVLLTLYTEEEKR